MILWTRILGQPKIFSGSPSISPEEGGEREGESGKKERKTMKGKESESRRKKLREKEKESLALPLSRADLKREENERESQGKRSKRPLKGRRARAGRRT